MILYEIDGSLFINITVCKFRHQICEIKVVCGMCNYREMQKDAFEVFIDTLVDFRVWM